MKETFNIQHSTLNAEPRGRGRCAASSTFKVGRQISTRTFQAETPGPDSPLFSHAPFPLSMNRSAGLRPGSFRLMVPMRGFLRPWELSMNRPFSRRCRLERGLSQTAAWKLARVLNLPSRVAWRSAASWDNSRSAAKAGSLPLSRSERNRGLPMNQRESSVANLPERGNHFSLSAFCGVGVAKWGEGRGEVLRPTDFGLGSMRELFLGNREARSPLGKNLCGWMGESRFRVPRPVQHAFLLPEGEGQDEGEGGIQRSCRELLFENLLPWRYSSRTPRNPKFEFRPHQ